MGFSKKERASKLSDVLYISQPPGVQLWCGKTESGSEGHTETIQYTYFHKSL